MRAQASARKKEILIVFTLSLAAFMGALDVSIVNISMPTIARCFKISTGDVSWVILVYLLILSSFLPAFGRLGDIKGFRKIFICGFAVFAAGSFMCGASLNFLELIAARIIQATGAAMLSAIAPSMVSAYLPQKIRGQVLGYVTTFASLGIAFLPRVKPDSPDKKFDFQGAALIFLSMLTLLYALNVGHEAGWTSRRILGAFSGAVIFGGLFLWRETRTPDPPQTLPKLPVHPCQSLGGTDDGGFYRGDLPPPLLSGTGKKPIRSPGRNDPAPPFNNDDDQRSDCGARRRSDRFP